MVFKNRIIFHGILWLIFLFLTQSKVFSQQKLQKEISFKGLGELNLREALERVEKENDFFFSYQSSLIEVNNPVTVDLYQGTLEGFLTEVLGEQYEFREIPGYIIIRYAPGNLDLEEEMDTNNKRLLINGYVKDLHTQENIGFASIYEKNHLVAALTDENGYFELRLRPSSPSVWLTLSKENYKDTTFMLLPPVDIEAKRGNHFFRYFPDDGTVDEMERSFFGRMFIGFRQRFQRVNLGGFFAESPFQMSLTPGLSSQGMFNSQMINKFSLNLLGGYTAGVEGFEMAGLFNINQKDVRYFQVSGIFNLVGGNVRGFQMAGIHNAVYGNVNGFQAAGIYNRARKQTRGLQIGGVYNQTDSMAHHQIAGLANSAMEGGGIQIAGLVNSTKQHQSGIQLAGMVNVTGGKALHQVAGLINKATDVRGIQLGLLNIASSSDYPIGLVNIIQNGTKSLALGMDETSFTHLTLRSGGRKLYGVLGGAYLFRKAEVKVALDAGFGWHLKDSGAFTTDVEFVHRVATDFRTVTNNTSSLRLIQGYRMGRQFKLFAGPTLNFTLLDPGTNPSVPGWVFYESTNANGTYGVYAGIIGGVQFVF